MNIRLKELLSKSIVTMEEFKEITSNEKTLGIYHIGRITKLKQEMYKVCYKEKVYDIYVK